MKFLPKRNETAIKNLAERNETTMKNVPGRSMPRETLKNKLGNNGILQ